MSVPQIEDVVDLGRFKYVCSETHTIETSYGNYEVVRGKLSDGSTGVPDLERDASDWHDGTYHTPIINGKRLKKYQIDIEYGKILKKLIKGKKKRRSWPRRFYQRVAAFVRPTALIVLFGHGAWRGHRKAEKLSKADHDADYRVPNAEDWYFPSGNISLAIWRGPAVEDVSQWPTDLA